jgi:hypothetical protein
MPIRISWASIININILIKSQNFNPQNDGAAQRLARWFDATAGAADNTLLRLAIAV